MLSLAEMASMAPTAGGQYHWVSEFSPPSVQKPFSYFIGWMSTLSWQAGTASGPFLVGTLIQSSAVVMYPDYAPTNWQGTLMVIAVTILVWVLNIWGARIMPMFQNIMLVVHVFGFLAIIIVFWVLSPRATAEVTFTQFTNTGGWSSTGLALMVGQLSAIYACICKSLKHYLPVEGRLTRCRRFRLRSPYGGGDQGCRQDSAACYDWRVPHERRAGHRLPHQLHVHDH